MLITTKVAELAKSIAAARADFDENRHAETAVFYHPATGEVVAANTRLHERWIRVANATSAKSHGQSARSRRGTGGSVAIAQEVICSLRAATSLKSVEGMKVAAKINDDVWQPVALSTIMNARRKPAGVSPVRWRMELSRRARGFDSIREAALPHPDRIH